MKSTTWAQLWAATGVTVGPGIKIFRASVEFTKTLHFTKKRKMPSTLRVGSEVSSICSKTARMVGPAPGKKRKTRERVYGVIMRSLDSGKWEVQWAGGQYEVQWAGGQYEALAPGSLKNEGEPTPETEDMVRTYLRSR